MSAWFSADEWTSDADEARSNRYEADRERRRALARAAGREERRRQIMKRADKIHARFAEKKLSGSPRIELSAEQRRVYLEAIADGVTQVEAARMIAVAPRTILRYANRDEVFAAEITAALQVRFDGIPEHRAEKIVARHRRFYPHCICGWKGSGSPTRQWAVQLLEQHAKDPL